MRLAERLKEIAAYLGTEMNMRLTRMREEGKDVINLGVGDPDVRPSEGQRRVLADACRDENSHHYPSFYSPRAFKEAIADWYHRRFGVACDPEAEVLPLLGSADGLFHIHTCLLDMGDLALVPDPCYPAYVAGTRIAGGRVQPVPLLKQNGFLPDLDAIPPDVARQARMIWVNYPNNPTAAVADEEFYRRLVDWARRYDVAVVSDNRTRRSASTATGRRVFCRSRAPGRSESNSTRSPRLTTAAAGARACCSATGISSPP